MFPPRRRWLDGRASPTFPPHTPPPPPAVAAALGLQVVGWIVTRPPPAKDASGRDNPAVSPFLLAQAAALQAAHPRADGAPGSRFVTLLVQRDRASGAIEPMGVQASDQLVSVVRDGVAAPPAPGDTHFRVRAHKPGEPPLPDVVLTDMTRGRYKSDKWDPDFNLVTLQAGTAGGSGGGGGGAATPLLRYCAFPVENRREFGTAQSPQAMAAHLRGRPRGEPYHARMADFHALVYLAHMLDVETAAAAAAAVAAGTPFSEGLELIMASLEG